MKPPFKKAWLQAAPFGAVFFMDFFQPRMDVSLLFK